MGWLLLVVGILSNAGASVLMKLAVTSGKKPISVTDPLSILGNWSLMASVILYGAAFVLYAMVLRILPLHIAHPILTAGAICVVSLCSVIFFGARLDGLTILGIGLILAGVVIVAARA
jgi:small multidrug resistance pump